MGVLMALHCDECNTTKKVLGHDSQNPTDARIVARCEGWQIDRGNYLCCPECYMEMKWCPVCRGRLKKNSVDADRFWCGKCQVDFAINDAFLIKTGIL